MTSFEPKLSNGDSYKGYLNQYINDNNNFKQYTYPW